MDFPTGGVISPDLETGSVHDEQIAEHIRVQRQVARLFGLRSDFAFTRQTFAPKEPEHVSIPERHAVAEPDGPDATYLALAAKLHVGNAAILEAKLERVLHAEMIPVYEYAKVTAYLDHLVAKRNYEEVNVKGPWFRSEWSWFSLRKGEHKGIREAKVVKPVYQGAIPLPVLMTIDKIQSQLPEARFFISQVKEVPDPFLAVSVPGSEKLWVVERWDEPGFRS
jgi:hypothetical protein